MNEKNVDKIQVNGSTYNIPPVWKYYNTKSGNDYSAVSGYVIQWPNGLQIITGRYSFNKVTMNTFSGKWGKFYESKKQYMPHYEVPFKNIPVATFNVAKKSDGLAAFISELFESSTDALGRCYVVCPASGGRVVDMDFTAIGEWSTYLGGGSMNILDKIIKDGDTMYMCPEVTDYTLSDGKDKVIKFQNGMMIIAGTRNLGTVAMTSSWGSMYESGKISLGSDFSEAFIEIPTVKVSITKTSTECLLETVLETTTTSPGKTWAFSGTSKSGTVEIDYIAVGRWK